MIGYDGFVATENVLYVDQSGDQPTVTSHGVVVSPSSLTRFLYVYVFLRSRKRSVQRGVPCLMGCGR